METRISKNLKHLRSYSQKTKLWVSDQVGKSNSVIASYESGKVIPPLAVLQKYAEVFRVDLGALVSRDLWIGEEGQQVEDPGIPYGSKRLEREKEALHGMLDDKEAMIKQVRAEIIRISRQLRNDPNAEAYHSELKAVLAILEKG